MGTSIIAIEQINKKQTSMRLLECIQLIAKCETLGEGMLVLPGRDAKKALLLNASNTGPQMWLVRIGGGGDYLAVLCTLYLTVTLLRPQVLRTEYDYRQAYLYNNTLSMSATCLDDTKTIIQ